MTYLWTGDCRDNNNSNDSIVLSGHRRGRRCAVIVNGETAWLTHCCFQVVIDLVQAKLTTHSGFSAVPSCVGSPEAIRLLVHRLRRSINDATNDAKTGGRLIVNDGNTNYMLNVNANNIGVDLSFFELPAPSVIPLDFRELLLAETGKKQI